ncbi:unnamed protein product [Symbiodinium sp. CCMP2592]|nr:unnamed protein product [Symbiodinium sp. CCMP2592]
MALLTRQWAVFALLSIGSVSVRDSLEEITDEVPQPDADPRAFPPLPLSQQALLAPPALLPPLVEAVADARTRRTTYLGIRAARDWVDVVAVKGKGKEAPVKSVFKDPAAAMASHAPEEFWPPDWSDWGWDGWDGSWWDDSWWTGWDDPTWWGFAEPALPGGGVSDTSGQQTLCDSIEVSDLEIIKQLEKTIL